MRKPKKGAKARGKKVGFFVAIFGNDPLDMEEDYSIEVLGTLDGAIKEATINLDDGGDVYTVYELVPRARVELPETPDVVVTKL